MQPVVIPQAAAPIKETEAVTPLARRRYERFVAHCEAALADEETARRAVTAGVVAVVYVTDLPGAAATLHLDRMPARVECNPPATAPDIVLTLPSTHLDSLHAGRQYLPLQILRGEVAFEGHIRKLLRVLPILHGAPSAADTSPRDAVGAPAQTAPRSRSLSATIAL